MKWTKTKLYWRNKQHDATIDGPCEMGWYRTWVGRQYKICNSLAEAKEWAASIAIPNKKSAATGGKGKDYE